MAASERRWAVVRTQDDLGRFLAEVRIERELLQDEVAGTLGITRRYLYEIESGKPNLYATRLLSLLRTLGIRLVLETEVPIPDTDDGRNSTSTRTSKSSSLGDSSADMVAETPGADSAQGLL